jgi:7-carboxy-7-deazaguanine synthase
MSAYAVKSIFRTTQGEGFHMGRAAVFIRFAGCDAWSGREEDRERDAGRSSLGCSRWCDTDFRGGERLTASAIVHHCLSFGSVRFAVLTGGEPLLQLDAALIETLKFADFELALETNGAHLPPAGLDWIAVSPKWADERWRLRAGDELKLIYPNDALNPGDAYRLAPDFKHYWLQPKDEPGCTAENTAAAVAYTQLDPRWRLSIQAHKTWGIP